MKNSVRENNQLPKYEDYIDGMVAFVVILGFESRVRNIKSEQYFVDVGKLLFAIKEMARRSNESNDFLKNLAITAISDSIIITMPYHDPICAMAIIMKMLEVQYSLTCMSALFIPAVSG